MNAYSFEFSRRNLKLFDRSLFGKLLFFLVSSYKYIYQPYHTVQLAKLWTTTKICPYQKVNFLSFLSYFLKKKNRPITLYQQPFLSSVRSFHRFDNIYHVLRIATTPICTVHIPFVSDLVSFPNFNNESTEYKFVSEWLQINVYLKFRKSTQWDRVYKTKTTSTISVTIFFCKC